MKLLKNIIYSILLHFCLLMGINLYLQSEINLNNTLKRKVIFLSESINGENLELIDPINENEYVIIGTNITLELKSDFDSYSLREAYINNGEKNYDYILNEIRSQSMLYYTSLRRNFAERYDLDITNNFSSPFISFHTEKVIDTIADIDVKIKKIIVDDDVLCSCIRKEISYVNDGGGGVNPYPTKDTPAGLLGKNEVLDKVNAKNTGYNGTGVNIGILEAYDGILGQPNTDYLYGVNVFKRESSSETSLHATTVTKCASWLAPNSNYYCSSVVDNYNINNEVPLNWMLDNNVNVINMSLGVDIGYNSGDYFYELAKFYDKFVVDNFMTIVVAAGNDCEKLRSPGICNNVISVGAADVTCTKRAYFSSYVSPYPITKPNLMAPGEKIFIDGYLQFDGNLYYTSGTSISAPFVTGAIAQMMQKRPILKLYPEAVQAILYNNANANILEKNNSYAGFDDENGAGMLDVNKTLENIDNFNLKLVMNNEYAKKPISMATVFVEAGYTLNINLDWLISYKNVDVIGNYKDRQIIDFDLYIYDSNGNVISVHNSYSNNSELARIPIVISGIYYICFIQYGEINDSTEHLALAWSVS